MSSRKASKNGARAVPNASHKIKKQPRMKAAKPSTTQSTIIPFSPHDRILLVGEGDFSFSASLLQDHDCKSLLATCFDDHSIVREKYPQAAANIDAIEAEETCKVLYGVDATKLGKPGPVKGSGGKALKKVNFDKVVFNFPHVGGLTKDVDRQVRHNQELLSGFLNAAKSLLADGGTIVVTLFEGEPYKRWDLRGLARQAGLSVERSFQFHPGAYPAYRHARTLGNIDGGGAWKGEDRPARTFLLVVNDGNQKQGQGAKKRKRAETESESESD